MLKRHQRNVASLPDDFISAVYRARTEAETVLEVAIGSVERDVTAAR